MTVAVEATAAAAPFLPSFLLSFLRSYTTCVPAATKANMRPLPPSSASSPIFPRVERGDGRGRRRARDPRSPPTVSLNTARAARDKKGSETTGKRGCQRRRRTADCLVYRGS